jgi:hypothetical protein
VLCDQEADRRANGGHEFLDRLFGVFASNSATIVSRIRVRKISWPPLVKLYSRQPETGRTELSAFALGYSGASYSGLAPANTGVGYILFSRNGILSAQPFDAVGRKLKGDAIRLDVPDGVGNLHSVSATGVLVYVTGDVAARNTRLVWYDRWGKQLGEIGTPTD